MVLNLLAGRSAQVTEKENQLQKQLQKRSTQTNTSSILYRHSANPVPHNASCQYDGYETYIPKIVDYNTMRETFIYAWCKKDHPFASHLILRLNGTQTIEETDPDYQGSDPLRDPYFATRDASMQVKDYTAEEYEQGLLLRYSYYPDYYRRNVWDFKFYDNGSNLPEISQDTVWISGSARDVYTQGTPNDPSDDYIFEGVYDNYSSEDYYLDRYYDGTGGGYAKHIIGTENGYKKETRNFNKSGKYYSLGAVYEDFTTELYRTDDDAWYYSMDGALTPDSCNGKKFIIKTIQSLYQPFTSDCPLEGELVVTYEDRNVTLRFLDNRMVEVDIDSDGIIDDTVSCQPLVDSGFCMP